jgi:hypothetical protein
MVAACVSDIHGAAEEIKDFEHIAPKKETAMNRLTPIFTGIFASLWALLLICLGTDHSWTGFPLDDAWIHLVYGRSVAEAGYLAYNSGVPASGSTSPLWAYVLGILHVFFSDPSVITYAVKITGVIFHGIMAWVCAKLVADITGSMISGIAAGIAAGMSPVLAYSSGSGMEVSMGCMFCMTAILFFLKRKMLAAGIFIALSFLSRPEYSIIAAITFIYLLIEVLKKKSNFREIAKLSCPPLAAFLMYSAWNLYAGARIFPSTFYVKAVTEGGMPLFDRIVAGFGMISAHAPLAGFLIWSGTAGFLYGSDRIKKIMLLLVSGGVCYAVVNLILIPPTDPEAFYHIRYLVPAVPLISTGLITGFSAMVCKSSELSGNICEKKYTKELSLIFRSLAGITMILILGYSTAGFFSWSRKFAEDCRNINEVQVELGKDIERSFDEKAVIATVDAGAVRYFGKRFTLDLMGLNTHYVLSEGFRSMPVDGLAVLPSWVSISPEKDLIPLSVRHTENYGVTSCKAMDTQYLLACRSEKPEENFLLTTHYNAAKNINLTMKCYDQKEIENLSGLKP